MIAPRKELITPHYTLNIKRSSKSPHLVAGLGRFRFIDLDTPMLLASDPFTGGYVQKSRNEEKFFQPGEYVYERTKAAIEHSQEHLQKLVLSHPE